jgi:hypothetical protein
VNADQEERTPEFVRWTIARSCPLRQEYRWTDPEQTERLLRPVRAAGDAIREGRVFQGVAFAETPPIASEPEQIRGFLLGEVLASFGGEQQVAAACEACSANVFARQQATWAGCYGMFHLADPKVFHGVVEDSLRRSQAEQQIRAAFHCVSPAWYGFWIDSPITEERARIFLTLLGPVVKQFPESAPALDEFLVALQVSLEIGLPMYAKLIPAGRRRDGVWKLHPHCGRCGAPRTVGGGPCRVCGVRGHECAGRTRNVRGERPYGPLVRQLGAGRLARLVEEYNARV